MAVLGGSRAIVVVAAVDCAALGAVPLDIALSSSGMLLFFYFDGRYDNYQATVGYWDPDTSAGARTLYVGPGEQVSPRASPDGIEPYQRVDLAAEPVVTFPALEHPDLQAAFTAPGEDLRAFLDHPVNDAAFAEALAGRTAGPRHQVGGYAYPVPGPGGMGGGHGRAGQPGPA